MFLPIKIINRNAFQATLCRRNSSNINSVVRSYTWRTTVSRTTAPETPREEDETGKPFNIVGTS